LLEVIAGSSAPAVAPPEEALGVEAKEAAPREVPSANTPPGVTRHAYPFTRGVSTLDCLRFFLIRNDAEHAWRIRPVGTGFPQFPLPG
jgi:hypothetical protein